VRIIASSRLAIEVKEGSDGFVKATGERGRMRIYRAGNGRFMGIFVPGDFEDFEALGLVERSPTDVGEVVTPSQTSMAGEPPRVRRARLTDEELPLQVLVIERPAGSRVGPHYHPQRSAPTNTRHQVMLCMSGRARVGIYTKEGEHIDTAELGPRDLVLTAEGHSLEFVEPGTRIVELQLGPVKDADPHDRVELAERRSS